MSKDSNFLVWCLQGITAVGEGLVELHNYIFFTFLTAVLIFVLLAIILILLDSHQTQSYSLLKNLMPYIYSGLTNLKNISISNYYIKQVAEKSSLYANISNRFKLLCVNKIVHGTLLEVIWTLLPSLVLIFIAVPSFALLYSMDEVVLPNHVIRAIGHQWYWSYENIAGSVNKNHYYGFDAYMIADRDLKSFELRLLEADNVLPIPVNTHIRFLFTSTDVLHSWTVPSLGIKVDAVPGRLSQFNTYVSYDKYNLPSHNIGLELYGQCSEICGVNHGFMPISVILV